MHARASVDAKRPQIAEFALFGSAVAKSVLAGFADRFVRDTLFPGAIKSIAFGLRQDIAAALRFKGTSFYAGHKVKKFTVNS